MLEAESDEGRNWNLQKVPCRIWKGDRWNERHNDCGAVPEYSYIVPDTTPFDIPDALPTEEIEEDFGGGARSMHADIHEMQRMRSLREQYAGLAMQALLPFFRDKSNMFEIAVASADALIAALNKKEEA